MPKKRKLGYPRLVTLNETDSACVVRYVAELWDRVGRLERQVLAMEIRRKKRA